MNIQDIKSTLGVTSLPLYPVLSTEGEVTEWLYNWDDANRVRIVMHSSLIEDISKAENLFIQTSQEIAKESGKNYTQHIICKAKAEPSVVL